MAEWIRQLTRDGKVLSLNGKLSGLVKVCDQIVDRVSKNDKSCHICSITLKGDLAKKKNSMGLCLYITTACLFG